MAKRKTVYQKDIELALKGVDSSRLYWVTEDNKTGVMTKHTGHMIDDLLIDD